ncbi:MAG: hypothetical protein R3D63_11650 [Paracoccaceae bacterium]
MKMHAFARLLTGAALVLGLGTAALADDTLDRGIGSNGPRWTRR